MLGAAMRVARRSLVLSSTAESLDDFRRQIPVAGPAKSVGAQLIHRRRIANCADELDDTCID